MPTFSGTTEASPTPEAAALLAHRVLPWFKLSDLHDLRRRAEQLLRLHHARVETIAISSDTEDARATRK